MYFRKTKLIKQTGSRVVVARAWAMEVSKVTNSQKKFWEHNYSMVTTANNEALHI